MASPQTTTFKPRMRVRLSEAVENFPTVVVPAGEQGTVEQVDDEFVFVKLDRHFAELDKWHNVLQVSRLVCSDAVEQLSEGS